MALIPIELTVPLKSAYPRLARRRPSELGLGLAKLRRRGRHSRGIVVHWTLVHIPPMGIVESAFSMGAPMSHHSGHQHELPTQGRALTGVAASATLHCLTG